MKTMFTHTHTHVYENVHSSFFHTSPKLKRTQMSFIKLGYTHPGENLLSNEKEKPMVYAASRMNLK